MIIVRQNILKIILITIIIIIIIVTKLYTALFAAKLLQKLQKKNTKDLQVTSTGTSLKQFTSDSRGSNEEDYLVNMLNRNGYSFS